MQRLGLQCAWNYQTHLCTRSHCVLQSLLHLGGSWLFVCQSPDKALGREKLNQRNDCQNAEEFGPVADSGV